MSQKLIVRSIDSIASLDSIVITFLGSGASGCVAKGIYNGKERIIKIVPYGLGIDSIREAFIGHQLKTKLPKPIANFFVGTSEIILAKSIPKSWMDVIAASPKQGDCINTINKANVLQIMIQDLADVAGRTAIPAHDWLAGQKNAVSFDTIRSIMFQLTLALSYAQSELGFQHNDLKLENLMFVEVDKNTTQTYALPDDDVFVLPLLGVAVRIIDFGGSSIRFDGDFGEPPAIIKTLNAYSRYNIPFEYMLIPNYNGLSYDGEDGVLFDRSGDADTAAMFKIMLYLTCHRRLALPGGSLWLFKLDGNGDGVGLIDTSMIPANIALASYYKRFDKLKVSGVDSDDQMRAILLHVSLYRALDPKLLEVKQDFQYVGSQIKNDSKKAAFIKSYFPELRTLKLPAVVDDLFSGLLDAITDESALHFLKLIGMPTEELRNSFGVPPPFHLYGLANALYHPFLAYGIWKVDEPGVIPSGALIIGRPLAIPLVYNYNSQSTSDRIVAEADAAATAYNLALNQLQAKKIAPVPKPAIMPTREEEEKDSEEELEPTPPSGGILKYFSKDGTAAPGEYEEWTAEHLNSVEDVDVPYMSEAQFMGLTEEQINTFDGDDFMRAVMKKFNPKKKMSENANDSERWELNHRYILEAFENWKRLHPRSGGAVKKIVPAVAPSKQTTKFFANGDQIKMPGPGDPWTSEQFDAFSETDIPKMTKEQFYGLTDQDVLKWRHTKYDNLIVALLRKFGYTGKKSGAERTFDRVKTNIKYVLQTLNGLRGIKAHLILEDIEHRFEYVDEDSGQFDKEDISTQLYVPLQSAAIESSLLIPIVAHLKLDKPLFDPDAHDVDMTNHANRTRYLHTLSVVADMIDNGVTQENVDRCFAEWPPIAPYKKGEVNEV